MDANVDKNNTAGQSLLLVEDDIRLAELVSAYLGKNGYIVNIISHGDQVITAVKELSPEIIVLDVGLPGTDGFSLCKALRLFYTRPILFLTANESDIDQVLGLELGADDYVVKPVDPRVLLARIKVLLRRQTCQAIAQSIHNSTLNLGPLKVNVSSRSVSLDNVEMDLSGTEFELLTVLVQNAGIVQSRESLFQQLFNRPYDGLDRSLDVRVSRLRKKIGDDPSNPQKIKTVWGRGYLLVKDTW